MSMKNLAEIQTALQNFLLDKIPNPSDLTLETPTFSREERLHIYHEAYRLRLLDALRNDYPAVEMYLGEDNFIALAHEFIVQHPSQNPSLRWLGEKLPYFLRDHSVLKKNIALIELAEFEWAQIMAFDAADINITTMDDVRALEPAQWMNMQLAFHPSVQLLCCHSNAPALWQSGVKENLVVDAEILNEPQDWLVWREALQVVYRPLEKPEIWALQAFVNQKNFAVVCAGLCEWFVEEQVPMRAAQYLQQWIMGAMVVKIFTEVPAQR
jgi:hypothetical protein